MFILYYFFSDEVSSLSKILIFYFYEQKAIDLQSCLDDLLTLIVEHKDEIWTSENNNNNNTGTNFEYGPGATVQTILEQRNSTMNHQNKSKCVYFSSFLLDCNTRTYQICMFLIYEKKTIRNLKKIKTIIITRLFFLRTKELLKW